MIDLILNVAQDIELLQSHCKRAEQPSLWIAGHNSEFNLLAPTAPALPVLESAWLELKHVECSAIPSAPVIGSLAKRLADIIEKGPSVEALLDLPEYARQGFQLREGAFRQAEGIMAKLADFKSTARTLESVKMLLQSLNAQDLCFLFGLRQTPGSATRLSDSLCLQDLLLSACVLHDFDAAKYQRFVNARKAGLKARGEPSLLTVAGRALTKHAPRDTSTRFWGQARGSKAQINSLANWAIARILSEATWVNLHSLPHEELALEVRQAEGFGCRWTLEPFPAFRGFLEPHMEDGHAKGWLHD
jgi:hypothetical protein